MSIRHDGIELPARPFPKEQARIDQGAIVHNKLLGAALQEIRAKQQARTDNLLASGKLTLREQDLLRHCTTPATP